MRTALHLSHGPMMSGDTWLAGERLLSLTRLKWLAIVAPVAFLVIVVQLLRGPFHESLHEFPGYLYTIAILAMAVSGFSFLVFGIIARLEQRVLDQNRELAALLAVGQSVTSSLVPSDQLAEALDAVLSVTSADAAELWLVGEEGDLTLEQHRGFQEEPTPRGTRLRSGEGLPGLAAERGEAVYARELATDSRCARRMLVDLGFATLYALPLSHRAQTVGVLTVAAREKEALSNAVEQRLLEGIGRELAVAIENARLHEQVLDRAVLEERERLARELHDSLAQLLGYVNTQTMAIKKLLASGREDEAKRQVAEMEKNAKRVYTDVREAILGLRTAKQGLLPSIRGYLADFELVSGSSPSLEVSEEAALLSLPDAIEIQLIRIIQEALTNVRKHADARSATVRLTVEHDQLLVQIEDDGCGFDLTRSVRTGWPHFGLQTMQERAHAIGGTFAVESTPAAGTKVMVRFPESGALGGVRESSAS